MGISIVEARKALMLNTLAGNASLLLSPSGYGKSSIVNQFAEDYRKRIAPRSLGVGLIFAATQTPPDLLGIMWKGERSFKLPNGETKTVTITDPSVPLWAVDYKTGKPYYMFDQFMVIIEEYGQGDPDVKRGCAEILLNGGVGTFRIPAGSPRVAVSNEGSRYGVTRDWLFAIARRMQIRIDPDVDATVTYLDAPYEYQGRMWQTLPVTKAWAKSNPQIVFEKEPKEDGPWCSPRTMCSVDRLVQVIEETEGKFDPENQTYLEMVAGTFGMPATMSYFNHIRYRMELPSYEDVVNDPAGVDVPIRADLRVMMVYELAGRTKPDGLAPCLQFLGRLPSDLTITYITSLLRRSYKQYINAPAMQEWIGSNSSRVNLITSLSSG